MQFVSTIYDLLQPGERMQITVDKQAGDASSLILSPVLSDSANAPEHLSEEAMQLRGALIYPCTIRGSKDDISQELPQKLQEYARRRSSVASSYSELLLREADKKGKELVSKDSPTPKAKKLQPETADPDTPASSQPEPTKAPETNPDSLF
jgi:hypothetical protein